MLCRDHLVDVAHHLADRRQDYRVRRQLDAEFVFDGEQQFGDAERVDAQRFKRRIEGQGCGIDLVVLDQYGTCLLYTSRCV